MIGLFDRDRSGSNVGNEYLNYMRDMRIGTDPKILFHIPVRGIRRRI